ARCTANNSAAAKPCITSDTASYFIRKCTAANPTAPTVFWRGEVADAEPAVPGWKCPLTIFSSRGEPRRRHGNTARNDHHSALRRRRLSERERTPGGRMLRLRRY